MWVDEKDQKERDETVADIQDLVDDCSQKEKIEGTYIRFDDLDGIAKNIHGFKDNLRIIVDQNGGIGKLADLTGIPQPSLSRFFSFASMPRRATLLKIAKALNLGQVQIGLSPITQAASANSIPSNFAIGTSVFRRPSSLSSIR